MSRGPGSRELSLQLRLWHVACEQKASGSLLPKAGLAVGHSALATKSGLASKSLGLCCATFMPVRGIAKRQPTCWRFAQAEAPRTGGIACVYAGVVGQDISDAGGAIRRPRLPPKWRLGRDGLTLASAQLRLHSRSRSSKLVQDVAGWIQNCAPQWRTS